MNPFRLQYNGLTITNDSSSPYAINKVTGLFGIPIRTSSNTFTGRDGGNIWNQLYDMRTINIEGSIVSSSNPQLFTDIRNLIYAFGKQTTNLPLKILLWDNSEKQIDARVLEMPMVYLEESENSSASFQIQLKCPDPYWYDTNLITYNLTIATGSGYPIPANLPMPLGSTVLSVTVLNTGDIETYPTITITGNIQNPTLTNTTTGQSMQFNDTLVTGDIVKIYRTTQGVFVTKNGSNALASLSGTYFPLQVGTNVLIFNGINYDSTANCKVEYYNKYLTIKP